MSIEDPFANREITVYCEVCGDLWFAPEGTKAICCGKRMKNAGFVESYKEPH